MALDHSWQVQPHPRAERGLDLYETPAVGTKALLRVEQIPHRVWEPAAGRGAITRVLQDHGHEVVSGDIHDYGFSLHFVSDFLVQERMPADCDCILTNPPYQIVEPFVAHALKLAPLVIMLLRLALLESERRCDILEGRGLARVHVFRKRLPMMHRDQWARTQSELGDGLGARLHRPHHGRSHFLGTLIEEQSIAIHTPSPSARGRPPGRSPAPVTVIAI